MDSVKKYGSTEEEVWATETRTNRDIVKVVLDFGVSQRQIMHIAYLLSLELEDRDALQAISKVIKEHLDGDTTATSKLIT